MSTSLGVPVDNVVAAMSVTAQLVPAYALHLIASASQSLRFAAGNLRNGLVINAGFTALLGVIAPAVALIRKDVLVAGVVAAFAFL